MFHTERLDLILFSKLIFRKCLELSLAKKTIKLQKKPGARRGGFSSHLD